VVFMTLLCGERIIGTIVLNHTGEFGELMG
jgi:hypothetical protein